MNSNRRKSFADFALQQKDTQSMIKPAYLLSYEFLTRSFFTCYPGEYKMNLILIYLYTSNCTVDNINIIVHILLSQV